MKRREKMKFIKALLRFLALAFLKFLIFAFAAAAVGLITAGVILLKSPHPASMTAMGMLGAGLLLLGAAVMGMLLTAPAKLSGDG